MVDAVVSTDGRAGDAAARLARGRMVAARLALAGAAVLLAAMPASAQRGDREGRRENCVCISAPWDTTVPTVRVLSSVPRARLGVELAMRADAKDVARGARIERIQPGSPAERAGLRAGDVITAINGRSVLEPLPDEDIDEEESAPAARVLMLMREVEPGDTVRVDYLRDGERRTAEVVARGALEFSGVLRPEDMERMRVRMRELREALPRRLEAMPGRMGVGTFRWGAEARFGIQVADLNPELGEYFGTREGVLVVRVEEDSPLGLRAGDVLQRVGGRKVEDAAHLRQILASYRRDETIQLEVLRKRQRMTLEARAP